MLAKLIHFLPPIFGPRPPTDLVWITPELAQSEVFASSSAPALARLAIGAVLDLRPNERAELAPMGQAGLHYLHLAISDASGPTRGDMHRAAEWVLQELADDQKVLIHHQSSFRHGVTVIAAVLLRIGYPLDDAVRIVEGEAIGTLPEDQQVKLKGFSDELTGNE